VDKDTRRLVRERFLLPESARELVAPRREIRTSFDDGGPPAPGAIGGSDQFEEIVVGYAGGGALLESPYR
jgi:hypothetical protein